MKYYMVRYGILYERLRNGDLIVVGKWVFWGELEMFLVCCLNVGLWVDIVFGGIGVLFVCVFLK